MQVYVTHTVAAEIVKIEKKPSYANLRLLLYKFVISHPTAASCLIGTRLNIGAAWPFVKVRLGGRGGYRLYYSILIKEEELIISAVYPKFGALSIKTLGPEATNRAYSEAITSCKSRNMLPVTLDHEKQSIIFEEQIH